MTTATRQNAGIRAVTIAVAAIMVMAVFRTDDVWNLKLLLLAPCLAYMLWSQGQWRWSGVDVAVAGIWVYDVLQCITSPDPGAAVLNLGPATTAAAVYALVRGCADRRLLTGALAAVGVLLSVVVAGAFIVFRKAVSDAGFESCYDFRFLLSPLAMTLNMATSLLLALTGISLSGGRGRWTAAAGVIAVALLLGFSRGALLGLGLLGTMLAVILRGRDRQCAVGAIAGAIAAVWLCCPAEMTTALSMAETQSQRSSAMSRVSGTRAAAEAFSENPSLGAGPRSYMEATDPWNDPDNSGAMTNLAPNWVAEIAVEKGAVGLVLYGALCLAAVRAVWRNRRDRQAVVCGATLLALALKEMTQSTVVGSTAGMVMTAVLLALIQRREEWRGRAHNVAGAVVGLAVIGVIVAATDMAGYRAREYAALTRRAADECGRGNYDVAMQTLSQLKSTPAVDVAKAVVNINAFSAEGDTARLTEAEQHLSSGNDRLATELTALVRLMRGDTTAANAKWRYAAYEHGMWLYRSGLLSEALTALGNYLEAEPRMMATTVADTRLKADSIFMAQLRRRLQEFADDTATVRPDKAARQGYLALQLGDTAMAEKQLRRAVGAMPSYSTPWRLLAEISAASGDTAMADTCMRRYRLLANGIFRASMAAETFEADSLSPHWSRIGVKYRLWHNTALPALQLR